MNSSLFSAMNPMPQKNIIQQFNEFRNNFKGDAQQQIQQMLNGGKISQAQYNAAVQKAQMLQRMIYGR